MEYLNRVIPVLTISGGDKLVKTVGFKQPNYIGDPINAVKIFNDKQVDEIVLLDINATIENREPNYDKIEEICSEAFMPFAYGGGIKSIEQIQLLFSLGIEKVVLNSTLSSNLDLIAKASAIFGSQSIVASLDIKRNLFGQYHIYTHSAKKKLKFNIPELIKKLESLGIGEIFLNSIDRDGTFKGYDLKLIEEISSLSEVPIVACGGAGSVSDFKSALKAGAQAVAAGSYFVYRSSKKGVLINYLNSEELAEIMSANL